MNNTSKVTQTNDKTNFERFYQGFNHFQSIDVHPDMVVFKLPTPALADDAYLKAQERINELCLPLVAKRTGKLFNTFLIREA